MSWGEQRSNDDSNGTPATTLMVLSHLGDAKSPTPERQVGDPAGHAVVILDAT
jgi:hypothetical protein